MNAMVPADCPCRRRQRALSSGSASANMAEPKAMAATPSTHSVTEWIVAGGVVAAGGAIGAIIGTELKHPWIGFFLGIAGGLAFNWMTGCPVCRDHAASMAAAT